MEDFTVDEYLDFIQKRNKYLHSGMADKAWMFVLERETKSTVDGGVTIELSEPYGVVLPDFVEKFSAYPKLSKYFAYDYSTRQMALRAEYCREPTDFAATMRQVREEMRNYPGSPWGLCCSCRDLEVRLKNGFSPEEYIMSLKLSFYFGIIFERYAVNVWSKTEDGEISILINKRADSGKHSKILLQGDYTTTKDPEKFHTLCKRTVDMTNSSGTIVDKIGMDSQGNEGNPGEKEDDSLTVEPVSFCHLHGSLEDTEDDGLPYFGITQIYDFEVEPGWIPPECEHIKPTGWFEWMTPKGAQVALLSEEFDSIDSLVTLDFLYRRHLLSICGSEKAQREAIEAALHPLRCIFPRGAQVASRSLSMIGKESTW